MKHILFHNFWLKLLSVVAAVVVWLLIINISDPIVTETYSDIPVKIINEDIITSKGYRYSIVSGETTDVKVKGKRSVVRNLKDSGFSAVADLNQLSTMYLAQISVKYNDLEDSEIIEITPKTDAVSIKLEESVTEPFNIRVVQKGEVKEGYTVISTDLSTNVVQVTGSKTQIGNIKEIVVEIDVTDKKDSFEINAMPVAYDVEGEAVDSMKISYNLEEIMAAVTIYPVKEVALEFSTIGNPARAHRISGVEFAPTSVFVAAPQERLDVISRISIPWDVSGIEESVDANIVLNDELTDSFRDRYVLVDPLLNVGLKINVIPLSIKDISISDKDIELRYLEDEYECTFNSTMNITMRLIGTDEELAEITLEDIHPYISFAGTDEGSYAAVVRTDYKGIVEIEPGTTMITVSKKSNEGD